MLATRNFVIAGTPGARPRVVRGLYLVAALSVAQFGCDGDGPSRLQWRPTPISSFEIDGPAALSPGERATFRAVVKTVPNAQLPGAEVQDVTGSTLWSSSNPSVLSVDGGLVSAVGIGEATLEARYDGQMTATRRFVIVPPGTLHVFGMVRSSGSFLPVVGARVEIPAGGLTRETDADGRYSFYGAPPHAELRISAAGFETFTTTTASFPQSNQIDANLQLALGSGSPLGNLNGVYTLVVGGGACDGSAIPPELRQRTYTAQLAHSGSVVEVTVSGVGVSQFPVNGFSGHVYGAGVRFSIEYNPWELFYQVAERLPDGRLIALEGQAAATATPTGLAGTFSGTVLLLSGGSTASCRSDTHVFALTR